jgi:predicted RNA-binding protein (virulence factor B family)
MNSANKGFFLKYKDGIDAYLHVNEIFGEVQSGDKVLVAVFYDDSHDRYWASEKIGNYLNTSASPYLLGQELDGIVYSFSPLGANIALDNKYTGILYTNEIFRDLEIGDHLKVFIKTIREDGKLDLSLQKQGYRQTITPNTELILNELDKAGGKLPFNDKSSPQAIQKKFAISKRSFKIALGALFKQKKITITNNGIESK